MIRAKTFAIFAALLVSDFAMTAQQPAPPDLSDASLEQLMNIDVISASRKEQKLSQVAAAMYVISQDDIRHSGATSITDLLRMVPGMDVEQVTNNLWSISARGFSNVWANKLLVLIDGRSVYNPALSGTLWDTQDVPLSDIERIEVIRGPGATIWGANAVNGVINIITKNSKDTTGGTLEVTAGSLLTEQTLAQYGGALGQAGYYRIFGDSTLNRANALTILGTPANDSGEAYHFGFRSDYQLAERDSLLVEGDLSSNNDQHIYDGFINYLPPYSGLYPDAASSHDASMVARWSRTLNPSSDLALQFYFDTVNYSLYGIHEFSKTADIDFHHRFAAGTRNDIVWGLDARVQPSNIVGGYAPSFSPTAHTNWLAGAFVQDEIKISNSFWLTAGTKAERNDYTGNNLQPSIRALWAPNKHNSVWVAVSRALREPSREDRNVSVITYLGNLFNGLPTFANQLGNPDMQAESLLAYEAGYRLEPSKHISFDLASFYNVYDHLAYFASAGQPFVSFPDEMPVVTIPEIFTNAMHGETYGGEFSATLSFSKHFKLMPGYSMLHTKLVPEGQVSESPYILQGDAPQNQVQLRSNVTLRPGLDWDCSLYYVSSLVNQGVPAYVRFDTRVGWRISDSFDLSIVGQNLTDHHYEFGLNTSTLSVPTYIGRSAYLRGVWHF